MTPVGTAAVAVLCFVSSVKETVLEGLHTEKPAVTIREPEGPQVIRAMVQDPNRTQTANRTSHDGKPTQPHEIYFQTASLKKSSKNSHRALHGLNLVTLLETAQKYDRYTESVEETSSRLRHVR